tara:strand:+ start:3553 stop:3816 length:264 start_codon:yes stop_codon:yes gene_type:complete
MNPKSLIPTLFSVASKAAMTAVTLKQQRRLLLLEEQQRMLSTFFKPTTIAIERPKDTSAMAYIAFYESDWLQIQHAITKLKELDNGI